MLAMAKKRHTSPAPLRWGPIATLRDVSTEWAAAVRAVVGRSAALAATADALDLGAELRQVRTRFQPKFDAAYGMVLQRAKACDVLGHVQVQLDVLLDGLHAFTRTAGSGALELHLEGQRRFGGANPYERAEHHIAAALESLGRFELLLRRPEDREPMVPLEQQVWALLEYCGMTEPELEDALGRGAKQRYLSRVCARMSAKGYEVRNSERIGYWRPDAPPGARPPNPPVSH